VHTDESLSQRRLGSLQSRCLICYLHCFKNFEKLSLNGMPEGADDSDLFCASCKWPYSIYHASDPGLKKADRNESTCFLQ
jgi:hypothetical protein